MARLEVEELPKDEKTIYDTRKDLKNSDLLDGMEETLIDRLNPF